MTAPTGKASSSDVVDDEVIVDDEYADVLAMFTELRAMPSASAQAARQRERILTRCLPLADHIARRYRGRGQDVEDLTQVARLGLVKAVDRFDASKGSYFAAFAVPTMMSEVRRHFRDQGWALHVPRRLKDRHGTITTALTELTQVLGRAPTASELAEHLDISREDVERATSCPGCARPAFGRCRCVRRSGFGSSTRRSTRTALARSRT